MHHYKQPNDVGNQQFRMNWKIFVIWLNIKKMMKYKQLMNIFLGERTCGVVLTFATGNKDYHSESRIK